MQLSGVFYGWGAFVQPIAFSWSLSEAICKAALRLLRRSIVRLPFSRAALFHGFMKACVLNPIFDTFCITPLKHPCSGQSYHGKSSINKFRIYKIQNHFTALQPFPS